jgi:lipopolysaccharide transport system ATP-binding protein
MFVRLAFAVAISVNPDILIIDEALAVGDMAFQSRCMDKLREFHESGLTIILVTHSHSIIAGLCTQALQFSNGALAQHGPPMQVLAAYEKALVQAERQLVDAHRSCTGIRMSDILVFDAKKQQRSHFRMHEPLAVQVSLVSGTCINNLCMGIEIRSSNGFMLWSTTSADLGLQLPPLVANTLMHIRWKFTAEMAPGTYSVAIGVGELTDGYYRRHDRLHHAAELTILDAGGIHGYLPLRPGVEVVDACT